MKLVLLLAWRGLVHKPGKTIASVLGIALGIATVVSVLVIDHNTLRTQELSRPKADPEADLLIQPELRAADMVNTVREDLLAEPLLRGVTAFANASMSLRIDGKARSGVDFMALDEGAGDYHAAYVLAEGRDLDWSSPAPQVLVTMALADRFDLAVGDLIELAEPARRKVPLTECVDGELVVIEPAGVRSTPQAAPAGRDAGARAGAGRGGMGMGAAPGGRDGRQPGGERPGARRPDPDAAATPTDDDPDTDTDGGGDPSDPEGGGTARLARDVPPVTVGHLLPPALAADTFPFEIVGILEPTRLGFGANRVLTTFEQGRAVMGRKLRVRFWADFDTSVTDLPTVRRALSDRYVVESPKRSLAGLDPKEKAFRSGVRFCGFLALFLGLYIIFNTMSMSLVERVRSIGLLRALGLTNGRLLLVFLFEGLVLALAGAGLSLVLAQQITGFLEQRGITTLGQGKPLVVEEIPWVPVLSVLVTGIVFCLAGVLYPFLRAARLSVIDALRRGVIELSRDPFTGVRRSVLVGLLAVVPVAWIVGAPSDEYVPEPLYQALLMGFGTVGGAFALLLIVPGLLDGLAKLLLAPFRGPAGRLARTTLSAARHRVFGTVSGLMLVFTAIFLIVSVLEALKAETRDFGARALDDRIYIKTTPEGAELMDALREAAPELAAMTPLNVETTSGFLVRALNPDMLAYGELADAPGVREAFVEEPSIILSTRCADDLDKQPNDTVRLATESSGLVDFRVLAVSDEYGFAPDDRVFGVVSSDVMLNMWCLDSEGLGDDFAAWAPGTSAARAEELAVLARDLLGEEHVLEFQRGEEITAGYVADLDRDFAIFYAILALTVLLAAVGILNAMVIAVMERRREIGLLRAVGLTGGQTALMLLAESGVLGVLGGVFGLLVGVPLAIVTCDALTATSHLDLAFQWSPRALSLVLVGAVVISVLAVILPALRANRLRLSEVMRYE